jgi:hypothetical protein
MKARNHIVRYPKFTAARSRLIPLTALLLATALGGCVAYTGYPSSGYGYRNPNYGYSYPGSYYAGYPRTYNTSYSYRPYYSPDYNRYGSTYGGGGN